MDTGEVDAALSDWDEEPEAAHRGSARVSWLAAVAVASPETACLLVLGPSFRPLGGLLSVADRGGALTLSSKSGTHTRDSDPSTAGTAIGDQSEA